MPTLPMLQNSSNNFSAPPIKHAASSADAGGGLQPGGASFGKVLADEMNGKYDAAEAKPEKSTASNTALNKVSENTDAAVENLKELKEMKDPKDPKDLNGSKNFEGLENLKDLKDVKGSETSSTEMQDKEAKTDAATIAIVTAPPLVNPTGMLPGLIAAQPLHAPTEVPTETQTQIPSEAKAEILAEGRNEARIDTITDISGDARTDAPIDVSTDVPGDVQVDAKADAPEAKLASTAGHHAAIAVMQPGLAVPLPGKTGTDTSTAMAPIAAGNPSHRAPGILAAAATPLARTRQAIVGQDIQDDAAIKLELAAKRGASQQVEFSSPEFSVAGQTGKSEKSLLELAAKDIHTPGLSNAPTAALTATPTALAAIVTAPAATGALVHTALWLEPRIGTAGWDNALGQKVLWMVSNQQQVAELNLDPPDLGPLQVILSITNDQASATFVSPHADVRQALEAALPRLKEMMAESGISLGNTTVSAETSQQQGGFERQYRPGTHQHRAGDAMDAPNVKSADVGMSYTNTGRSRLVDTFA